MDPGFEFSDSKKIERDQGSNLEREAWKVVQSQGIEMLKQREYRNVAGSQPSHPSTCLSIASCVKRKL